MDNGRRIALSDSFDMQISEEPAPVLGTPDNGTVPNFSRVWQRARGGTDRPPQGGPRLGGPNRNAWVLSELGRAALDSYDSVFDDPALECSPVSIRRLWGNNDLTEIEQTADSVIIRHEWMDAVREVNLMLNQHPENLEPRLLGHSIGWYEDDTLVIDTIGYEAGMLEQHPGLPHSEHLHTVERLTLAEEGNRFEITILMEDPLYFTDQLSTSRSFVVANAVPQEYNCTHPELGR